MAGPSLRNGRINSEVVGLASADIGNGGSCATYGCTSGFDPQLSCQCDQECIDFGNCCPDHKDVCGQEAEEAVPVDPDATSTTQTTTEAPCSTAPFATECYKRVIWVTRYGVHQHPEWYPNITVMSTFEETQALLHKKGECGCPAPCAPPVDPSAIGSFPSLSAKESDTKPLLEQVAAAITTKLAKASLAPFICNPVLHMGGDFLAKTEERPKSEEPANSSEWRLPQSSIDECFDQLLEKAIVREGDRQYERNWCWVGLKELGCHSHFYDHLTWSEMQQLALEDRGTANVSYSPLKRPEVCDLQAFGGTVPWKDNDWDLAREWFKQNVAVYILSLPASLERREFAKTRFGDLGIDFSFVDGVDMRREGAFEQAQKEDLIPQGFNVSMAQTEAYKARQNMGVAGSIMGTVGCASGHFRAQRHGLMHDPKYLTLVFEDDVSPEDDFIPKLWRLVTKELPCDWQAVSLNSRCPFGECVSPHLTRVQPDINEPAWRCRHGVNYGFQGMLYRTSEIENLQKEWKPVVFDETRPHCLDVDVALASISDRVRFYAVPASQNPGFLHEVSEGSSRVDINFQKMGKKSTSTSTSTSTTEGVAAAAMAAAEAAEAAGLEGKLEAHAFCGNRQEHAGADGEEDSGQGSACVRDGRSKGWCSRTRQNCLLCSGTWCTPDSSLWQRMELTELRA